MLKSCINAWSSQRSQNKRNPKDPTEATAQARGEAPRLPGRDAITGPTSTLRRKGQVSTELDAVTWALLA